jgi:hypothetical protein
MYRESSAPDPFVLPMHDKDLPAQYRQALTGWRTYGRKELGYTGPVAWKDPGGFEFEHHAHLAGPCYRDSFNEFAEEKILNNKPTKPSIIFWVPRLVKGSVGESIYLLEQQREQLRVRYGLPPRHAIGFGSFNLLINLILAHHRYTKERVPSNHLYTATDSFWAEDEYSRARLITGFFTEEYGLDCETYNSRAGHGVYQDVGFFLLGVEELDQ